MWKNLYNGGYGINARQDITRQYLLCNGDETEEQLRSKNKLNPDEIIIRDANTHQLPNGQWLLKVEKHPDAAEFFAAQSPNHIGAAVTSTARHHMNLLLFHLTTNSYGYTDTDSAFVHGAAYEEIKQYLPHLLDESPEANMGTYKNDHEGPGENVVFFSMLLAKKVKLHVTLNAFGEVQFHDTFKGFNPAKINANGDVNTDEVIHFQKVRALGEIFFHGSIQSKCLQTEWKRSLATGITIHKDKPFEVSEDVYFKHYLDVEIYCQPQTKTSIEILVPHGETSFTLAREKRQSSNLKNFTPETLRAHRRTRTGSVYPVWCEVMKMFENEANEAQRKSTEPSAIDAESARILEIIQASRSLEYPADFQWQE